MKTCTEKMMRKLGLTLISMGKHMKCRGKDGKIYILSQDYLKQAEDNPRFAKLTNKCTWQKNKSERQQYAKK